MKFSANAGLKDKSFKKIYLLQNWIEYGSYRIQLEID